MRRYSLGPRPKFHPVMSGLICAFLAQRSNKTGSEALKDSRGPIGTSRRHRPPSSAPRSPNALSQRFISRREAVSALMTVSSDAPLAVFGFLTDFDLAGGEFIGIGA